MAASPDRLRIVVRSLSYTRTDGSPVFYNAGISFEPRRYGLIGNNGSGKSTLLRAIAGEYKPDSGTIAVLGTVAYLPQGRFDDRSTRSGGEWMRHALNALLARNPDWLLLDEPTNHLDRKGREALYAFVRRWQGGLIAASHDRELLEHVDEIVAIERHGFVRYGGNYAFYEREAAAQRLAAQRNFRAATNAIERERLELAQTLDRSNRAAAAGKRHAAESGMDKMQRGNRQRAAQRSASKAKQLHEKRVEDARDRAAAAEARIERVNELAFDAERVRVGENQLVAVFEAFNVQFADETILWQTPLSLTLRGPVRILVLGENGRGKSLFLRALEAQARIACAYLDQHLTLLSPYSTAADAMREYAPQLAEHERRIRLARAGFAQERGVARIDTLSGGERMRLALALTFAREPVPKLLLMDEPTNDLDLRAARELAATLREFPGALVVVSHDERFIADAGIRDRLELPLRN